MGDVKFITYNVVRSVPTDICTEGNLRMDAGWLGSGLHAMCWASPFPDDGGDYVKVRHGGA